MIYAIITFILGYVLGAIFFILGYVLGAIFATGKRGDDDE